MKPKPLEHAHSPTPPRPWSVERVADRLRALVDEHGAPNCFHLSEVAADSGTRGQVLSISAVARKEGILLNRQLAAAGLSARYNARNGRDRPACFSVDPLAYGVCESATTPRRPA